MTAIAGLRDHELKNMSCELGRLMGVKARELEELRQRHLAVKLEIEKRRTATQHPGIHISDHAVVRYLERVKGVDIDRIRIEIGDLAAAARRERMGRRGLARNGELLIGVNDQDGTVTTVYSAAEGVVVAE